MINKPKLIRNWDELEKVPDSEKFKLEISEGSGWIINKETEKEEYYLSTHTFYKSTRKSSTKLLQDHGFNVVLEAWS